MQDDVDATADGVTFTITFNDVEVPVRPRRRSAGALRARHPRRARGALGHRRATFFESDEILVKHDEQYEADNGDRIADAEDGRDRRLLRPVNATLGTAGIVLGVAASALGIVTVAWGLRTKRPALLETGWSYSLLVLLGAVVAVIAMQRALITRDFSVSFVHDNGSTPHAAALQRGDDVVGPRGLDPAVGARSSPASPCTSPAASGAA